MRTRVVAYVEHREVPDPETLVCRPAFERELYDLAQDPYQLENRVESADLSGADLERLADRLARLSRCSGIKGRDDRASGQPFCE